MAFEPIDKILCISTKVVLDEAIEDVIQKVIDNWSSPITRRDVRIERTETPYTYCCFCRDVDVRYDIVIEKQKIRLNWERIETSRDGFQSFYTYKVWCHV